MTDKEKAYLYGGGIAIAVVLWLLWNRNSQEIKRIVNEAPFTIPPFSIPNSIAKFGDYVINLANHRNRELPALSETSAGYNSGFEGSNSNCSLCMTHEQVINVTPTPPARMAPVTIEQLPSRTYLSVRFGAPPTNYERYPNGYKGF